MKKIVCLLLLNCPFITQASDWLPIHDKSLEIVEGSALDFSKLVESGDAGQHGRIIVVNGHLAFSDNPNIPRRFFCASQPDGTGNGVFPDHASADRYAKQVRLHGYNVARFHFVEHELMEGQHEDFVFNAEQLDRLYYFLAALKREGVYWLMDGMSSWNGAYGDVGENRWIFKHDLKMRVHFDPEAQAHWKRLIQQILNQQNPYTKLTTLQDPALLGVILVNEGGLNHVVNLSSAELSDLHDLGKHFSAWLTKKYGSTNKAFEVWGENLDSLGILMARRDWNATPRVKDTQLFYYEMQKNTFQWMTEYLRGLGYQGLVTAYDNWPTLQDAASRATLTWVDMHAYHEEPSDWISEGSSLSQQSSFSNHLAYIRDLASSRYWSKPFTVSEYDQPFWDKNRYEAGLAIGAYASFQNWDLICRHSGAIELGYDKRAVHPFDVGLDPIARTGETLAALLFARKDVKPALYKFDLRLTSNYVFNLQAGIGKLSEELSTLALITGLGLTWQEPLKNANLDIEPNDPAPTLFDKALAKFKKWLRLTNDNNWIRLFAAKVMPEKNLNDRKLFQSDTGEIILNAETKTLSVNTQKTQAVAFADTLPDALSNLSIINTSSPALLAASSLDDSGLANSKRMLLIYATNAQNTDMQFNDSAKRTLTQLGSLPVQLKNSRISFTITNNNAGLLHLYALHLNGERATELPIEKIGNDKLRITLDLNNIAENPTTYFELATQ